MTDFKETSDQLKAHAKVHCRKAKSWAAVNASVIVTTAFLAAAAAVTSQTDVPTWVTTVTAGLSAALAVITGTFKFQDKASEHTEIAADLDRLAARYDQLVSWHGVGPEGTDWFDNLDRIGHTLEADHPVPDEALWAGARVPATSAA